MHIEITLNKTQSISDISYLEALFSSHFVINKLVRDLHKIDETMMVPKSPTQQPVLAFILDRSFDDLFVPYTEGDRYIDIEKRYLNTTFTHALAPFKLFIEQRKKQTKHTRQPSSPIHATTSPSTAIVSPVNVSPSSAPFGMVANRLNQAFSDIAASAAAGIAGLANAAAGGNEEAVVQPGMPVFELVLDMIAVHSAAIRRCRELNSSVDLFKNVSALFKLLVDYVGTKYVEPAMEIALDELVALDTNKSDTDLKYLSIVKVVTNILKLLQLHFQEFILPNVCSSPTTHREVVLYKNEMMSRIEIQLNNLIQSQSEVITNTLASFLTKQKKIDFKPKDENIVSASNTLPCTQACEFLTKANIQAKLHLKGENLEAFLTDIGNQLN
ncbi:Exocyst complex component 5, partial [Nowakowskiella sp. JEL0078]